MNTERCMGKNLNKNEEKKKKNPVSKQPLTLAPEYSRDHNTNYENISNTFSMTVRHKGHGLCFVCSISACSLQAILCPQGINACVATISKQTTHLLSSSKLDDDKCCGRQAWDVHSAVNRDAMVWIVGRRTLRDLVQLLSRDEREDMTLTSTPDHTMGSKNKFC